MITSLLPLIIVNIFAAMSPGPDFVVVAKNTISHGRGPGTWTALGIALGLIVHISYCIAGVGVLISQSIVLFNIIKIAGGLYLLYIGIQAIRYADSSMDIESQETPSTQKTGRGYLIQGFIVNVLNPKAALYFVALFTTFVPANASNLFLMYLAIAVVVTTALRFVLIANIIGLPIVRAWFVRYTKWINRICGGLLGLFGLKLMAMHK